MDRTKQTFITKNLLLLLIWWQEASLILNCGWKIHLNTLISSFLFPTYLGGNHRILKWFSSKVEIVVRNLKRISCWHGPLLKHKLDKPSSQILASYPGSHKGLTWHWKNTRLTTTRTRKSDLNNSLNLARKHSTNLLPVRSLQHSFYIQIVCHLKLIQNSKCGCKQGLR